MNWKAKSCTWLRRPPVTLPNQMPEMSAACRIKTETTREIVTTGSRRILSQHTRQRTGAVGESLHRRAECIQHRHEQVGERSVLRIFEVLSRINAPAAAAPEHQRKFVRVVAVAIAQR